MWGRGVVRPWRPLTSPVPSSPPLLHHIHHLTTTPPHHHNQPAPKMSFFGKKGGLSAKDEARNRREVIRSIKTFDEQITNWVLTNIFQDCNLSFRFFFLHTISCGTCYRKHCYLLHPQSPLQRLGK